MARSLALPCALAMVACGGSDGELAASLSTRSQPLATSPEETAVIGDGVDDRYFIGKFDEALDTSFFAVALTDDPVQLAAFDPAQAGIPVAGFSHAVLFGAAAFIPQSTEPALARFDVEVDGTLTAGPSLSFAEAGLTSIDGFSVAVQSETKGYVFDPENARFIAWDPSTMQLTGATIDLAAAVAPDRFVFAATEYAAARGDQLLVPIGFFDQDFVELSETALAIIDTTTDQLTVIEDSRCAGYAMAPSPAGDFYFYPADFLVQDLYLAAQAPRPELCSLRLAAGQDVFDPDYELNLSAVVGGDETSGGGVQGAWPDGLGGMFISAADEEVFLSAEDNEGRFYRPFHLDLENSVATALPDAPLLAGNMLSYGAATGPAFALQPSASSGSTTVVQINDGTASTFEMAGAIDPVVALPRVDPARDAEQPSQSAP